MNNSYKYDTNDTSVFSYKRRDIESDNDITIKTVDYSFDRFNSNNSISTDSILSETKVKPHFVSESSITTDAILKENKLKFCQYIDLNRNKTIKRKWKHIALSILFINYMKSSRKNKLKSILGKKRDFFSSSYITKSPIQYIDEGILDESFGYRSSRFLSTFRSPKGYERPSQSARSPFDKSRSPLGRLTKLKRINFDLTESKISIDPMLESIAESIPGSMTNSIADSFTDCMKDSLNKSLTELINDPNANACEKMSNTSSFNANDSNILNNNFQELEIAEKADSPDSVAQEIEATKIAELQPAKKDAEVNTDFSAAFYKSNHSIKAENFTDKLPPKLISPYFRKSKSGHALKSIDNIGDWTNDSIIESTRRDSLYEPKLNSNLGIVKKDHSNYYSVNSLEKSHEFKSPIKPAQSAQRIVKSSLKSRLDRTDPTFHTESESVSDLLFETTKDSIGMSNNEDLIKQVRELSKEALSRDGSINSCDVYDPSVLESEKLRQYRSVNNIKIIKSNLKPEDLNSDYKYPSKSIASLHFETTKDAITNEIKNVMVAKPITESSKEDILDKETCQSLKNEINALKNHIKSDIVEIDSLQNKIESKFISEFLFENKQESNKSSAIDSSLLESSSLKTGADSTFRESFEGFKQTDQETDHDSSKKSSSEMKTSDSSTQSDENDLLNTPYNSKFSSILTASSYFRKGHPQMVNFNTVDVDNASPVERRRTTGDDGSIFLYDNQSNQLRRKSIQTPKCKLYSVDLRSPNSSRLKIDADINESDSNHSDYKNSKYYFVKKSELRLLNNNELTPLLITNINKQHLKMETVSILTNSLLTNVTNFSPQSSSSPTVSSIQFINNQSESYKMIKKSKNNKRGKKKNFRTKKELEKTPENCIQSLCSFGKSIASSVCIVFFPKSKSD